jgi:hypothetical protein
MIESYLTGAIGLAAVLAAWVWVQNAWRRSFPDATGDPDTLAGRPGCGACEQTSCKSGPQEECQ